ncbi:DUF4097 family beta strand repeat-containing protein [Streptomyces caelestis]|uniref:Ferric-dicitrate binding protein FerR (Iron transport regulator) n=1 Tax=Streptomyces caelestis TaxID=36816 RepID=A0A7W9H2F3_9ACTN|nr:DUF4097 family beta strand repeat-containing protein [Streptomyces caelestis]MBB5794478.1 ferric-dicitrate binding protein FerR (iron transport regulator) [Streptomyces caelestis]GGW30461.1 lipoprotein [Streptomyces caelestis]
MARTTRTSGTTTRPVSARAVAVAGAVVVLVAGLSACGASAGDDTEPDHRSFGLQGRTLTVASDDSALEIVAADSNPAGRIEVTRWFQGSVVVGKDPKATWSMRDDRLVLRLKCSGVVVDCSAKHRIEVPRGVSVKVQDGDGSVRARGFRDPLSIRTGDGSVRVTGSTGPLNIRTGDGSVRVTDTTGPLRMRTGDGSIRASVSSRDVRAHTGDGSVRLELGAVPDRVESRSGDGSVTIAVPKAAYRVTAETGDGGVDVSVPRDESSSHVVSARTGDGKVTVRTAN